ncbi:MAG: hypothetical protein A2942_02350 [Candidatus Lloydbacteria bacterium RIFCSPLOWO2_01_FULL_50_20]|uniref:Zinc finger DksA/TraR C4-type domain-containing protein n=1 Tax=Candidatus Lloydbacteria bacterium RIFCSPLOWO2_01_FULL_50_20 TaxID=1798665 RepID=A0A1G2DJS4_9BACT|nr:MAG: hypothetical protein A2942_02350 [Candidatus Lloydbacteria bacterium RIFCSPLOWO2_01_FULL_50_20]
MTLNIEHYQKKLLEEKARLLRELKDVGRINPDNENDWEPVAANLNIDPAEEEERAEEISDFENRSAVEFELEKRFNEIERALERIEKGTYGVCSVCQKQIEEDRLEANYSAETCKTHKG